MTIYFTAVCCISLFEALQTLYWGTFGLIEKDRLDSLYRKHTFTMFIGLLMFGVYCSIMIIVLINMLIAMMSNSYQIIAVKLNHLAIVCLIVGYFFSMKFSLAYRIKPTRSGSLPVRDCGYRISKRAVRCRPRLISYQAPSPFIISSDGAIRNFSV